MFDKVLLPPKWLYFDATYFNSYVNMVIAFLYRIMLHVDLNHKSYVNIIMFHSEFRKELLRHTIGKNFFFSNLFSILNTNIYLWLVWTYFIENFIKGIGHKLSNLFRPLPIRILTNSIFHVTCIRRSWTYM